MFPRSGVRQIEGIAFYHAMLDVPLSKLGMELKRRRTLSNAGPTSDKEHFTSYVHVLSMVQNPDRIRCRQFNWDQRSDQFEDPSPGAGLHGIRSRNLRTYVLGVYRLRADDGVLAIQFLGQTFNVNS